MAEEEQKQEETKQEKKEEFQLVEVPTQMGIAVQTPEGETVSQEQLLVRIANDLAQVKKGIVG